MTAHRLAALPLLPLFACAIAPGAVEPRAPGAGIRSVQDPSDERVDRLLAEAKAELAPDRRTVVFDVEPALAGKRLTLTGEVHDADLGERLVEWLSARGGFEIVDELRVLPDPELGEHTRAVTRISVANLRGTPSHSAELVTQVLLGMPLRVLKRQGGWRYVQAPNDYLGWIDGGGATSMTSAEYRAWLEREKVMVTADHASVRVIPESSTERVSDVVAGCILAIEGVAGTQYRVQYPDGRVGFLHRKEAEPLQRVLAEDEPTPLTIVATAHRLLGAPYLWGGTSPKGMDCSGFTSTVYYLNGILLPRDASQQVLVGEPVAAGDSLRALQPGDLLFFGRPATTERRERVSHVAISLGGPRFIHSSGDVRVNSLDPGDSDFSASLRRSFLRAKRILGAGEGTGVRRLDEIPYYRGDGL